MIYVYEIDKEDKLRVWSARNLAEYHKITALSRASIFAKLTDTADIPDHMEAAIRYNKRYGVFDGAESVHSAILAQRVPWAASEALLQLVEQHRMVAARKPVTPGPA